MYARLTECQVDANRIDEAIVISSEQIGLGMQETPGFQRMFVLGDRATGDTVVFTLWESAEAEQASRSQIASRFAPLGDILLGPPKPTKVYEVVDVA